MPKYGVEITPEFAIEVDFPPGAPAPRSIDIEFEARTEEELRDLIPRLGFDAATADPTSRLMSRYGLAITRDGEAVGRSSVLLWISEELRKEPLPPIPALARIREEARAKAAELARERQNADAVAWAQGVGRPVALEGGEVVER